MSERPPEVEETLREIDEIVRKKMVVLLMWQARTRHQLSSKRRLEFGAHPAMAQLQEQSESRLLEASRRAKSGNPNGYLLLDEWASACDEIVETNRRMLEESLTAEVPKPRTSRWFTRSGETRCAICFGLKDGRPACSCS